MGIDLKPYFDAAEAADNEVQKVMGNIKAAFEAGTEEGKALAMGMKDELDAAQAKAKAANDLYISMRNASGTSDTARVFVPVNDLAQADADPKREMGREAFLALDAAGRMAFIKGGGKVID